MHQGVKAVAQGESMMPREDMHPYLLVVAPRHGVEQEANRQRHAAVTTRTAIENDGAVTKVARVDAVLVRHLTHLMVQFEH